MGVVGPQTQTSEFQTSSLIARHSQAAGFSDLAEFLSDWMVRYGQGSAKFHKCNRHNEAVQLRTQQRSKVLKSKIRGRVEV